MKQLLFLLIMISLLGSCSQGVTRGNATAIKVMSYNIHHANPPSKPGVIDLDAIASVIKAQSPDVVSLQEVDVNTERSGKGNHQAAILAQKLGMNYFFARAINFQGGEYGVAVLSRFALSEGTVHRLTTQAGSGGEPRVLATVRLTVPGLGDLRFACTHLDAERADINRLIQVKEINAIAAKERLPLILAGDLNAEPGSEVINTFDHSFTRTCTDCEYTIPVINPTKAIDFIAYRPAGKFKVISHRVIPEQYASDHLPVTAELAF